MTLTQQEIEKIEREVKEKYSCPYTTEDLRSNDAEYVAHINRSISDTILLQIGYKDAATKYLTQLKEERERSKKLLEAEEERTNYWVSRCMAAEQCIEKSPCDPDVTKEQIEAHRIWEAAKKNENNNQ